VANGNSPSNRINYGNNGSISRRIFQTVYKQQKKAKKNPLRRRSNKKKMASYLHRTATTTYLCCVPTLEDSAGAGRVGLAVANIQPFYIFPSVYNYYNNFCIL